MYTLAKGVGTPYQDFVLVFEAIEDMDGVSHEAGGGMNAVKGGLQDVVCARYDWQKRRVEMTGVADVRLFGEGGW